MAFATAMAVYLGLIKASLNQTAALTSTSLPTKDAAGLYSP